MSATNRGGVRNKDDAYYTPDALAVECLRTLSRDVFIDRLPYRILEPSVGSGSFRTAMSVVWPWDQVDHPYSAVGVDVRPGTWVDHVQPFETFDQGPWDLIAGNPPYSLAEQHIRHAMTLLAPSGILAFLLRINFLGSMARAALWRDHPLSSLYVVRPRPGFTANGRSDSTEYGWFVWGGPEKPVKWLDWQNGKGRR